MAAASFKTKLRHQRDQAIAKVKGGEFLQALAICDQMIRDAPSSSIGLRTKADVYEIAGDAREACRQLQLAIDQGIALVVDRYSLAILLVDLAENKEALDMSEQALALADDEEMAFLGEALRMTAAYSALRAGDRGKARLFADLCAEDAETFLDGQLIRRKDILALAADKP